MRPAAASRSRSRRRWPTRPSAGYAELQKMLDDGDGQPARRPPAQERLPADRAGAGPDRPDRPGRLRGRADRLRERADRRRDRPGQRLARRPVRPRVAPGAAARRRDGPRPRRCSRSWRRGTGPCSTADGTCSRSWPAGPRRRTSRWLRRIETLDQQYAFIRTHIFWIRDAEPLGAATVAHARDDSIRTARALVRLAIEAGDRSLWGRASLEFILAALALVVLPWPLWLGQKALDRSAWPAPGDRLLADSPPDGSRARDDAGRVPRSGRSGIDGRRSSPGGTSSEYDRRTPRGPRPPRSS